MLGFEAESNDGDGKMATQRNCKLAILLLYGIMLAIIMPQHLFALAALMLAPAANCGIIGP
jgi:hypothetical protein